MFSKISLLCKLFDKFFMYIFPILLCITAMVYAVKAKTFEMFVLIALGIILIEIERKKRIK